MDGMDGDWGNTACGCFVRRLMEVVTPPAVRPVLAAAVPFRHLAVVWRADNRGRCQVLRKLPSLLVQCQDVLPALQALLEPQGTHTHPFNGPFSGTTRVSRYQKVKPIWILLKQETVSGSSISWAICKFAPRSIQTTIPAPNHSVFYRPDALPAPNQQRQSTEGNSLKVLNI